MDGFQCLCPQFLFCCQLFALHKAHSCHDTLQGQPLSVLVEWGCKSGWDFLCLVWSTLSKKKNRNCKTYSALIWGCTVSGAGGQTRKPSITYTFFSSIQICLKVWRPSALFRPSAALLRKQIRSGIVILFSCQVCQRHAVSFWTVWTHAKWMTNAHSTGFIPLDYVICSLSSFPGGLVHFFIFKGYFCINEHLLLYR